MAELITEIVAGEPYQYYPLGQYVVRAIGVCGQRPTFKYTRIEITGTLERLAAGDNIETIVKGYQGRVSREAILEAIRLVNRSILHPLQILKSGLGERFSFFETWPVCQGLTFYHNHLHYKLVMNLS